MSDRVPLAETQPVQEEKAFVPESRDGLQTFMDDIEYHRVASMFDLDFETRKDQDIAEKLSHLTDWGRDFAKSTDSLQVLSALKQLQKNLGLQGTGRDAIKKLYQWTRLDNDRKRIEKKMELLK